ncbi:hypothetical protein [Siphonobacter sp. SORGH_AS_1065]|uniref:hypothetical protein n=1 Tax=Siphonobacter sp. SORGH_AS_1065 TaxID=3041795 RepID=UPI002789319E|nr:hypothetical protein [Siphonobacter sp. SORGH_AS_1065]MDQ1086802.1 hypothetical protein [Siphonobacter sp. SORGH_AS_1065]
MKTLLFVPLLWGIMAVDTKPIASNEREMAVSFVIAIHEANFNKQEILEAYFSNGTNKEDDIIQIKRKELIGMVLESVHQKIAPKDLRTFQYVPYEKLHKEEKNLLHKQKYNERVFCVKSNNETLLNLLIKDKKILSFITMDKGGTRFWVML